MFSQDKHLGVNVSIELQTDMGTILEISVCALILFFICYSCVMLFLIWCYINIRLG